jgi:hypothetical protein
MTHFDAVGRYDVTGFTLACIPIYDDRGRDLCGDPAGSQESAPELGVGSELAIKTRPYRIAELADLWGLMRARTCACPCHQAEAS